MLESLDAPLGVVDGIAGQSRLWSTFAGRAGHAGTLPMQGRRDALAAAAELVLEIERLAREMPELRATVGSLIASSPERSTSCPGTARLCVDVRHADDEVSNGGRGRDSCCVPSTVTVRREVAFGIDEEEHHRAVPADPRLSGLLGEAVVASGQSLHRLTSGAGHDAAVMAAVAPMAMLFVRSPGGVSHSPDERVLEDDVRVALEVVVRYLACWPKRSLAANVISRIRRFHGSLVNGTLRNDTQPPAAHAMRSSRQRASCAANCPAGSDRRASS